MKIRLFILLLTTSFSAQAESLDTIRINENTSATLQFSATIEYVVIANNPVINKVSGQSVYKYYDMFTKGGVLILRAKGSDAPKTTITIYTEDDKLFTGFIRYGEGEKNYYDLRTKGETKEESFENNIDGNTNKKDPEILRDERLNKVITSRDNNVYNLGKVEGSVLFQVEQILNDDKYSYMRISVDNQSASKYEIKGVMFRHITGKNRSIKEKDVVNVKWLDPVTKELPPGGLVRAYDKQYIGFVIPVYASDKGNLMIRIAENEGQRNCELKVSTKIINKVEVFE
jgi:hypothetical protein